MLMQRISTGTTGKIFKAVLLGVLFAAVAGLIMTDAGGFFRNGVGRQDVARIGHKSIGLVTFAQNYRQALQNSGMAEDDARRMGAPFMVLQQEVGREVLLQAAHKAGVRISDAYIGAELNKQLAEIKQPGTPQEKLNLVLQQRGVSEKMFVDQMRGDYAINVLNNAAISGDLTPPTALLNAIYDAGKEKRIAQIVSITPDKIPALKNPDDGTLQEFYDENKERYKTQEKRDVAFVILPKGLFAKDVDVSDTEVQKYYTEHQNEFLNPERVHFEQIISDNEKDAKAIAAKGAGSLKDAKVGKAQYVAADWYTKATLPTELQKAIYPDKKTGLIGPVQTSIGWHVIKIDSYEDAKPKDFAEVKDSLAHQLKDEKLDGQVSQFSDHLDSLISSGQGLKAIAEEYKVSPSTISDITTANAADKVKAASLPEAIAKRITESAFSLDESEVSPLIDMPNGDYALLQVTKVDASKIPPLASIKDQVMTDTRKAGQEKALIAYAEKVIGQYDTRKPDSFLEAVKKNNLNVETTNALTQTEATASLDKGMTALLFSLTPNNRLSFTNSADKVNLIFLKEIVTSKDKPSDTELADLKKKTSDMISNEIHQQFMQAWQNDIGVAINNDLVKKQFIDAQAE